MASLENQILNPREAVASHGLKVSLDNVSQLHSVHLNNHLYDKKQFTLLVIRDAILHLVMKDWCPFILLAEIRGIGGGARSYWKSSKLFQTAWSTSPHPRYIRTGACQNFSFCNILSVAHVRAMENTLYKCIITIISNFLLFILKIMYKCQCTLQLCGNRRKRTQTILAEGKKW